MPFKLIRFITSLNNQSGDSAQEQLMDSRVSYDTLTAHTQKAAWIGNLINDLTVQLGADNAKAVMEACGQQCIGRSILDKAKIMYQHSRNIDGLLVKLNQAHIGGGQLRREDEVIYASYARCYCDSVSNSRLPISIIYCQCSCGWFRKLFETILEKTVKVEIVDSIIHGANTCQFKI